MKFEDFIKEMAEGLDEEDMEMLNSLAALVGEDNDSAEQAKEEMFEAIEGNLDRGEATIVVLDHPEDDGIQVIQYSNPRKTVELLIEAIGNITENNPEILVDMLKELVEADEEEDE